MKMAEALSQSEFLHFIFVCMFDQRESSPNIYFGVPNILRIWADFIKSPDSELKEITPDP